MLIMRREFLVWATRDYELLGIIACKASRRVRFRCESNGPMHVGETPFWVMENGKVMAWSSWLSQRRQVLLELLQGLVFDFAGDMSVRCGSQCSMRLFQFSAKVYKHVCFASIYSLTTMLDAGEIQQLRARFGR